MGSGVKRPSKISHSNTKKKVWNTGGKCKKNPRKPYDAIRTRLKPFKNKLKGRKKQGPSQKNGQFAATIRAIKKNVRGGEGKR